MIYRMYRRPYLNTKFLFGIYTVGSSEGIVKQDEGVALHIEGQVRTTNRGERTVRGKHRCLVCTELNQSFNNSTQKEKSYLAAIMAPKTIVMTLKIICFGNVFLEKERERNVDRFRSKPNKGQKDACALSNVKTM